ncbi:MAG: phosphoribosylglycinamide formyltransferase [Crocinitomicaceae bacterium]
MGHVKRIAIFASGGGSNAEAIICHFKKVAEADIHLIITNNPNAGVIERAKKHGISYYVHSHEEADSGHILQLLQSNAIDFIVLAGYLKKIHPDLIQAYPHKIVNIHPALLPKFGGKGMYGMHVHRAVVDAGEKKSGATIHYVNEAYDEGAIIEQHSCAIEKDETPEEVQKKVLELEHRYYPACIEQLIKAIG